MNKSGVSKKHLVILSLSVLFVILFLGLVSAQATTGSSSPVLKSVNQIIDTVKSIITPVIAPLLGESIDSSNLMAKLLFVILVFCVVWLAMDRVPFFHEKGGYMAVISIVASIISVRVFSSAVIETILLPYEAFGITLTAGIPFALYFIVVNLGLHDPRYKTIRRIAWLFFSIVFFILWITRMNAIPPGVDGENLQLWFSIYPITALLGLLLVTIDGSMQRVIQKIQMDRMWTETSTEVLDDLRLALVKNEKLLKGKAINIDEYILRKRKLEAEMKKVMKDM